MLPLSGSPIYVIDKNWVCFSHPVCPPEKGRAYRFWVIFVIQVIKLWKSEMKGQDIKWGCISPPVHQISVFPLLSLHPIHACFRPKRKRREQNQESQMVREEFEKGGGNYAGRNQTTDITTIWEMVKKKKKKNLTKGEPNMPRERARRQRESESERKGRWDRELIQDKKKDRFQFRSQTDSLYCRTFKRVPMFTYIHIYTQTHILTYSHTQNPEHEHAHPHAHKHTWAPAHGQKLKVHRARWFNNI